MAVKVILTKSICEDEPTRKFLSELKRLREAKGYTRRKLAERVGVVAGTIKFYELEATLPVLWVLMKLAEFLEYDLTRSINYKYYHGRINLSRLRGAAHKKGITTRELAKMTGYSSDSVRKVLRGAANLSLSCLYAVQTAIRMRRAPKESYRAEETFTPELMRRLREDAGMTQRELSEYAKLSRAAIQNYELGRREPTPRVWYDLYEKLKRAVTTSHAYRFRVSGGYRIRGRSRLSRDPLEQPYCEFIYEGKRGMHHVFRERTGGWLRTYTDAQLVGKRIEEVQR